MRDDVVRFEYRVWGSALDSIRQRLDELAESRHDERVNDCYLLGPNAAVNAKLRDCTLEVKRMIPGYGFQRWEPSLSRKPPFPVELVKDLANRLGCVDTAELGDGSLAGDELIATISAIDELETLEVIKERQLVTVQGIRAESTRVTSPVGTWWTVAGESTDRAELEHLIRTLGIEQLENRSMNAHFYQALMGRFAPTRHPP